MPTFDLRTVLLMASVMPGLMALVMFSIGRTFPRTILGVAQWAQGSLLFSAAAFVMALRDAIPDWLSVVVGNVCIVGSIGLWLIGTQRYLGRVPCVRLIAALALVDAVSLSWMTWADLNPHGRSLCTNVILLLLFALLAYELLRYGDADSGARVVGSLFAFETLIASARVITLLQPVATNEGLYAHDRMQMIYLSSGAFMSLSITVGFMLTAVNRLRFHLEQLSRIDPLTGLLNRRALLSAHTMARETPRKSRRYLSLLLIDLDHFKRINDTYGHSMGDDVLVDFARRAVLALPPEAELARWGGEEFAVLFTCDTVDEPVRLARALQARIASMGSSSLPSYTCSIGVACLGAADASIEQLLKQADGALYRAKDNGRNRVEVALEVVDVTVSPMVEKAMKI
ncbi:GGDEF domain-containing protein [Caballeronia sp. LZ062]|uniref:GGDEF domain-containing protein n=1 Tax=unclassified Caballeronia TaxID=2646786 RepID=UPI0028613819|nr:MULTISPECIES: GGDEF domain-containing protein [unclassified Caballeronia]MDR5857696.1 GGDEF domain-containing protein [Caballeronia sp. LZ050]MDR5869246.1 GGDEF domain-containing protein [Caballeronia sp. LZ062]